LLATHSRPVSTASRDCTKLSNFSATASRDATTLANFYLFRFFPHTTNATRSPGLARLHETLGFFQPRQGRRRPRRTRLAPLARQVAQITENIDRLVRHKAADAEADTSGLDEPWDESVI
jgi:hypothetical protein